MLIWFVLEHGVGRPSEITSTVCYAGVILCMHASVPLPAAALEDATSYSFLYGLMLVVLERHKPVTISMEATPTYLV